MALFQKEKIVGKVLSLPIHQIQPNPAQPRRYFDQKELEGLGESIRENGLLQPVTVCRLENGRYQLVAGERRLCASQLAGCQEIEAILVETDSRQSAVLALLENLQRTDLNCFEEAQAIAALLSEQGLTQEEAARKLGFAQSTIANKLRLLRLSPQVQKCLLQGGLGERHARALVCLPEEQRLTALKLALGKNWNAKQLEEYVKSKLQPKTPERKKIRPKWMRDARLFLNTVDKTVKTIRRMGFAVETSQSQEEGYLEYVLRFPLSPSQSVSEGEKVSVSP